MGVGFAVFADKSGDNVKIKPLCAKSGPLCLTWTSKYCSDLFFWPWSIYLSLASLTENDLLRLEILSTQRWKDGKSNGVWKQLDGFFLYIYILDWAGLPRFRFASQVSNLHEPIYHFLNSFTRTHLSKSKVDNVKRVSGFWGKCYFI